jgi:hypothetical protein
MLNKVAFIDWLQMKKEEIKKAPQGRFFIAF